MTCRRCVAVGLLALAALVVMATPAAAHAGLVDSDPDDGQVLSEAPSAIVLRFNEPVRAAPGGLQLLDARGDRVRTTLAAVEGEVVRVDIPAPLRDGGYVVVWRVASEDGHPIDGVLTFRIGTGGAGGLERLAGRLLEARGSDSAVRVTYGIARLLVFASLPLLVGTTMFGGWLAPAARRRAGVRRLVVWGWVVGLVGTVVGLVTYGPYAYGGSLADAFDLDLLADTMGERAGAVALARLALLVVALPLLGVLVRAWAADRSPPRWWPGAAAVVGLGLVVTPGVGGHASSGELVVPALVADALHVTAMAAWLGGLAVLAVMLCPDRDSRTRDGGGGNGAAGAAVLTPMVDRFSRMATVCIGVIVVTGIFQSWRQMRSLDALVDTDYGRTLLVKVALVAVAVACAGLVRRIVRRPDTTHGVGALRRSVGIEAVVLGAVLVATAVLVDAVPPRRAAEALAGTDVTLSTPGIRVGISLDPGRVGPNDVEVVIVDADGDSLDAARVVVTMAPPEGRAGELYLPLRSLGGGRYVAPRFEIPVAGEWRVTSRVRVRGQREARVAEATVPIG